MGKLDCCSIVRAGEGMSGKQEVLWMPLSASPRLMLKLMEYYNNPIEVRLLTAQTFKERMFESPGHQARNHDQPRYLLRTKSIQMYNGRKKL